MEIKKSELDTNEYREIRLANGVVGLLISKKHRRSSVSGVGGQRKSESSRTEKGAEREEEDDDELLGVSQSEEETEGQNSSVRSSDEESESNESDTEDEEDSMIKSACAVCIGTGSLSDPPDIPGLAHLLEHMVFMGSEKYSGENTFESFLSKHGGFSNASTDYEKTVFYFTITPRYFQKALDMFAHFFASPLLLESTLEREIEAVDSEFQSSLQSDSDRLQRLLCSTANHDHPYSTFVWGNAKSLKDVPREKGIDLGERLRLFYQRHYSSHYMTVAIMSTDSLDELEQWTRESFSAMPHNNLPLPDFKKCPPAFDRVDFHKLYRVVPVADVNEVQLLWQLPCLFERYQVKPVVYLSWLLGHEGEGSVLHYLKRKHLATEILVGNSQEGFEYNSCFSLFNCTLTLTAKGHQHIEECLECVFQYLQLLRECGPQETVFREIQTLEQNRFTFKEEEDPAEYTEELCEAMQFYPTEDYLTGNDLLLEYDPKVITEVLDGLTADTVNIIWSSRQFEQQCQLKEEWFGTPYSTADIPVSWKEAWKSPRVPEYLHLPLPNPFIATDFTINPPPLEPNKYPVVVSENDIHRLWFRQDTTFKLPRASLCLVLENPVHQISAKNAVLLEMLVQLLDLNLSSMVYNANMALLQYTCSVKHRGIVIKIDGLNEILSLLFKVVVDSIVSFSTKQGDFDMVKEELHRSYRNSGLDPEDLCRSTRIRVLLPTYWTSCQRDSEIDALTIADLMELIGLFRECIFAEVLIQGNITSEEARSLAVYLCSELNFRHLNQEHRFKPGVKRLPAESVVSIQLPNKDSESPNTVITDYYQCCPRTVRDLAIASLLVSCMKEPAFDDLRTKKQLGYGVYMDCHISYEMVGFTLTVVSQSAKNSVERVGECMQHFISGFHHTLKSWGTKTFQSHVRAMIHELLEPDVSLDEEVSRNWDEIMSGQYCFDSPIREAVVLSKLSLDEVCDWLLCYTRKGSGFKELRVLVQSQDSMAEVCTTDGPTHTPIDGLNCVLLNECDIEPYKATLETFTQTKFNFYR